MRHLITLTLLAAIAFAAYGAHYPYKAGILLDKIVAKVKP